MTAGVEAAAAGYRLAAGVMTALELRLEVDDEVSTLRRPLVALSSPVGPVCFFAWPSSVVRQRVAKFREQTVSPKLYTAGEMFTKVSTLELPPRESCANTSSQNSYFLAINMQYNILIV